MCGPMPNPALSGDSMSLSRAVLRERLGQQIAVADFGRIALVESDLQVVLDAAVSCCARSLGAEFAKVLRYVPERKVLVLQAGYGWGKEYIGMEFADADMDSAAGFALRTGRSEEPTSELKSLMRISYAVFCLK